MLKIIIMILSLSVSVTFASDNFIKGELNGSYNLFYKDNKIMVNLKLDTLGLTTSEIAQIKTFIASDDKQLILALKHQKNLMVIPPLQSTMNKIWSIQKYENNQIKAKTFTFKSNERIDKFLAVSLLVMIFYVNAIIFCLLLEKAYVNLILVIVTLSIIILFFRESLLFFSAGTVALIIFSNKSSETFILVSILAGLFATALSLVHADNVVSFFWYSISIFMGAQSISLSMEFIDRVRNKRELQAI